MAIFAMGIGAIISSCSKEEDMIVDLENSELKTSEFTVRPDFASLDTRPPAVIAQHQMYRTNPVEVISSKKKPPKPPVDPDPGEDPTDPPVTGNGKYALVIGISDYDGTANDLTYCDDDAMDWKSYLQSEGYTVTVLTDQNATAANIEAKINDLASNCVEGAEIAFCYSGHGSRGNIISSDLYYISASWFQTKFANSLSSKMMFCFDACQIGEMATALNATGRVVAVASSTNTYSYDGDASMQNGVFTYYQMVGFDQLNYTFLEPDCDYAITEMKAWAKARRLRVAPSYVDSFSGDFDI